jgi:SAM-dependent methyltransferase
MHSFRPRLARALVSIILATWALAAGAAQTSSAPGPDYVPQVGQEGKDVIWVPTPQSLVERMLDMTGVTAKDYVIDLGAGDGRTVIAAAKRGARALGIEFNPDMVALAKRNAEKAGVSGNAQFIQGDIFKTDFSKADVLTLYLLPSLNLKLRPTILKMRPGTRVVSHAFTMDDWQPDQTDTVENRTAYMWIVPAAVEGTWQLGTSNGKARNDELVLRQRFQYAEGLVRINGKIGQLRDFKVQGTQISFTMFEPTSGDPLRYDFTGRVSDDTMGGVVKLPGGERTWTATRVPPPAKR